jgi:hypothetical protein
MYVLVFITLIVALIGLYSQLLINQTANFNANQTTVAGAMTVWHSTAILEAKKTGIPAPGAGGCMLTNAIPAGGPAVCASSGNNIYVNPTNPAGTVVCPNAVPPNYCYTDLPPGYNIGSFQFYSVFYQVNGQSYVVTFVPPPTAPVPGYIVLPGAGGTQVNVTMGTLMSQIKNNNTALSPLSYGTVEQPGNILVSGTICMTSASISTCTLAGTISYPLPTGAGAYIPNHSIAIISSPT